MELKQIIELIIIPIFLTTLAWLMNTVMRLKTQTTETTTSLSNTEKDMKEIKEDVENTEIKLYKDIKNTEVKLYKEIEKCEKKYDEKYKDLLSKVGHASSQYDFLNGKLNESDKQIIKLDTTIDSLNKTITEIKTDMKEGLLSLNAKIDKLLEMKK